MKHLNLILIILILSCCPLHPAYAFFDKDIRLLTMRDGLADNTIPCIYKDEDGFMWFGTDDGLSRYATEGTDSEFQACGYVCFGCCHCATVR